MMPQVPYLIYGTIIQNKVAQGNVDVTIKNVTKNQEVTIKSTASGQYSVDLGDTTKFPSGYSENDVIRVTTLGSFKETSVTGTGSSPPTWGKKVNVGLSIYTVDALFKKLGVSRPLALDVDFKKTFTKTAAVDAMLRKTLSKGAILDALFKKSGVARSKAFDVILKKFDIQMQRSVDSCFAKLNQLKQYGVDVRFGRNEIAKTFALDAIFGLITVHYLNMQLDALFKKAGIEKTAQVDVAFRKSISLQKQVDAIFRKTFTQARTMNTLFKKAGQTAAFLLDAYFIGGKLRAANVDALFRKQQIELQRQIDAIFKGFSGQKTLLLDVVFSLMVLRTIGVDAAFRKTQEKAVAIDCRILKATNLMRSADAVFKKASQSKTFGLDTWFGEVMLLFKLEITCEPVNPLKITAENVEPLTIECEAI